MKAIYALLALLSIAVLSPNAAEVARKTEPRILEKGQNYRVWSYATTQTMADGRILVRTNQYTELAIGLHYRDATGAWSESQEVIDVVPGGAMASKGPHRVGWAANANTYGAVNMLMPDGRRLRSHVLGLAYVSAKTGQRLWIATIRDSIGELGPEQNQVLYRDALDDGGHGLKADIRYTYTRAGMEQDIVFRPDGAPLPPEAYGFSDPKDIRLEVITEFVAPPVPGVTATVLSTKDPAERMAMALPDMVDQTLDFGVMRMQAGQAFPLDQPKETDSGVPTAKTWHQEDGRTYLIEAIEYPAAKPHLDALETNPLRKQQARAIKRPVPDQRFPDAPLQAKAAHETMKTAALSGREGGYVIDYAITSGQTNFTLAADMTYYVGSGTFYLWGTTVIEGGTVVKFTNGLVTTQLRFADAVECRTAPYRPAIFTSMHDDTVGAFIQNSTSNPTNYCGIMVYLGNSTGGNFALHDIHVAHAYRAIFGSLKVNATVSNCQVRNSVGAFNNNTAFWNLRNVLVSDVVQAFTGGPPHTNNAEHITFYAVSNLVAPGVPTLPSIRLTNSLLIAVTNGSSWVGTAVATNSSGSGIFQAAGQGAFYLVTNSPHIGAGTSNIDADLLAQLRQRTVFPPQVLTNILVGTNLTLGRIVAWDTNANPTLGYHYDPLDFLLSGLSTSNTVVIATNGVAIAVDYSAGSWGVLLNDSRFISEGSALSPNRIVRAHMVQERSSGNPSARALFCDDTSNEYTNELRIRFTHMSQAADDGYMLYSGQKFRALEWTHSAVYNPSLVVDFLLENDLICGLTNTLWERGIAQFGSGIASTGTMVQLRNNLFRNFAVYLKGNHPGWVVKDNLVDGSGSAGLFDDGTTVTNSHNAYASTITNTLSGGTSNITVTNLSYVAGPMGPWYQPTNSVLIDQGSTTADQVGLFRFTTTTNQVRETNSLVDIGLHYPVLNAPPITSVPGTQTVAEDTALFIAGISISDPDGDDPLQLGLSIDSGVLTLSASNGVTFLSGTNPGANMVVLGISSDLNTALQNLKYSPPTNYHGTAVVVLVATDFPDPHFGAALAATNGFSVVVTPVNDPPVAVTDSYTTNEDVPLVVNAPGVLENDSDIEGNPLTAVLATGPSYGAVALNANGSFTYTPNTNYHGTDSFTYQANDGSANSAEATVSITINPTNDPPIISIVWPTNDASIAVSQNITVAVSVFDVDAPGTGGTITQVQYFTNSVLIGTVTNAPFSFVLTNWPLSTNTIVATATDDAGATGTSAPVTFSIDIDSDGDGITDKQEQRDGTDPSDYYNGDLPVIHIVQGNEQVGRVNSVLPLPLEIQISSRDGTPLHRAPVAFAISSGAASIGTSTNGSWNTAHSLQTDTGGLARVYLRLGSSAEPLNLVSATIATASNSASVTFSERCRPQAISVATSSYNTGVLFDDGTVQQWGETNTWGGVPLPGGLTNIVQIAYGGDNSPTDALALRADGTVVAWGNGASTPGFPSGLSNVMQVAVGGWFGCALLSNQTVVCWSGYAIPEIGIVTNVPASATNVVRIAAAGSHVAALRSDGTAFGWGDNYSGQIPTNSPSGIKDIVAGYFFTLALLSNGTVTVWGQEPNGCWTPVPSGITNAVGIGSGYMFGAIILADGTIRFFGRITNCEGGGYVAVPTEVASVIQVAGGYFTEAVALLADGTIVRWGHAVGPPMRMEVYTPLY